MRGADEEVSGNVNQELLRLDGDNSQLFWGGGRLSRLCRKNI